jgi:hypothetical protein
LLKWDGFYTTVDNTRVLAAREAGVNVNAKVHEYNELISPEMAKRFVQKKTDKFPFNMGRSCKVRQILMVV